LREKIERKHTTERKKKSRGGGGDFFGEVAIFSLKTRATPPGEKKKGGKVGFEEERTKRLTNLHNPRP